VETVYLVLRHLGANGGVAVEGSGVEARFANVK
jgi:hypothetical protein